MSARPAVIRGWTILRGEATLHPLRCVRLAGFSLGTTTQRAGAWNAVRRSMRSGEPTGKGEELRGFPGANARRRTGIPKSSFEQWRILETAVSHLSNCT